MDVNDLRKMAVINLKQVRRVAKRCARNANRCKISVYRRHVGNAKICLKAHEWGAGKYELMLAERAIAGAH